MHIQALAVGEHAGQHAHLYIAGHVKLALDRGFLGCGKLQFFDILYQRLLHVAERVTELTNLIGSFKVRQFGIEIARSNRLGLARQTVQRLQLARNYIYKYVQHYQQADKHDKHYGMAQAVKAAEYIALGAHNGHRTARFAQRLVEHIAILAIYHHAAHALLATLHGMTQGS